MWKYIIQVVFDFVIACFLFYFLSSRNSHYNNMITNLTKQLTRVTHRLESLEAHIIETEEQNVQPIPSSPQTSTMVNRELFKLPVDTTKIIFISEDGESREDRRQSMPARDVPTLSSIREIENEDQDEPSIEEEQIEEETKQN